ncbi:MAG: hypothetical protein N7Q72_03890, partial [Spiroplasma sp. Tabriz.8]|nr:hypothetical protein [Spiroplasma sp. Tabriz.8]
KNMSSRLRMRFKCYHCIKPRCMNQDHNIHIITYLFWIYIYIYIYKRDKYHCMFYNLLSIII